jgi:hypothetical protein
MAAPQFFYLTRESGRPQSRQGVTKSFTLLNSIPNQQFSPKTSNQK